MEGLGPRTRQMGLFQQNMLTHWLRIRGKIQLFYESLLKMWFKVGIQSINYIRYMSVDQACKKLVHQYAISYQFFMTLKGVTGQCQLQGKVY